MKKEKLYSLAKVICKKLEDKILSNNYLVLFQSQIIETESRTSYFRFDDIEHAIYFQEYEDTFIEIIAEYGCTNEITSVKKLKDKLCKDFIFINKKYATNFLGRKTVI